MTDNMTVPASRVLLMVLDDKPADGLLAVAYLMRDQAQKATPGRWGCNDTAILSGIQRTDGSRIVGYDYSIAEVSVVGWEEGSRGSADDDAAHIASMANPAVALALAGWLEHVSKDLRTLPADISQALYATDVYGDALAVAKAYLAADIEEA